jgi:hypothetical protein
MKKILLPCAVIGCVLCILATYQSTFNGHRVDFHSGKDLLDLLLGVMAFTLAVIPFYLLAVKIKKERDVMNTKVKLAFSTIALTLSTVGLYYDDGPDWKKFQDWGIYVAIIIYGFIFFMIISLAFLFLRRRFD